MGAVGVGGRSLRQTAKGGEKKRKRAAITDTLRAGLVLLSLTKAGKSQPASGLLHL